MHKTLLPAVCLGLGLTLGGCVAPQTKALRVDLAAAPAKPPVELKSVPFFPQEEHQCGPAALATVLRYSGAEVTPEQLVPEVYVPGRKGSFQIEMVAAARRHGRVVYPVQESLKAILAALDEGLPVLVLQNNSLPIYPIWHYAVVVGADRSKGVFILRSGRSERLEIDFSTFERTWARSGYWAALMLDPATLSDGLDPGETVRQLAALEAAGSVQAAQTGFWRAVLNWPDNKIAWLGLANSSVELKDYARAESAFRELVRRHPQYGAGLNNYADFLLQQGRAREALPYAERAVSVLDVDATRRTLIKVQAVLEPDSPVPAETSAGVNPP